MPLLPAGSPAEQEMRALVSEQPQQGSLGMSAGLHAWWAGQPGPNPAWLREVDAERAAYTQCVPLLLCHKQTPVFPSMACRHQGEQ